MNQTLPVYIEISQNAEESIASFLASKKYSSVFVLLDENTKTHCYPLVKKSLKEAICIEIKSGEQYKNLDTCQFIWSKLTRHTTDRKALLINLGGGVIGDMGGFCAATYKRGIDFINIPTTLLSQVDASIGGKLGIDFQGLKNHIGLFQLPNKVIIDSQFLHTLPHKQLLSGFAEMLKHGLIADGTHFKDLINLRIDVQSITPHLLTSIQLKNRIVLSDPTESNNRKLLNWGHTLGHAIETFCLTNNTPILHGEAVAAGIIMESYLSEKILGLSHQECRQIEEAIDSFYQRVSLPKGHLNKIAEYVLQDKKNEGNSTQAVLLQSIGKAQHSIPLTMQQVKEAILYYIK